MKEQPAWVCLECGNALGKRQKHEGSVHISSWSDGTCGVCLKYKSVTEPRDFGYLVKGEYNNGRT